MKCWPLESEGEMHHSNGRNMEPVHTAVPISYWSLVMGLSTIFLMGGLYASFRISLEVRDTHHVTTYNVREAYSPHIM